MRRLTKNKRKTSETNSEIKQENGDASETTANVSEMAPRVSKTRKSRNSETEMKSPPIKRMKPKDDDPMCREPEKVIDSRIHRKKVQYKVRWLNYSANEDTWESPDSLDPVLIEAFKETNVETEDTVVATPKASKSQPARQPAVEAPVKPQNPQPKIKPDREYEVESILDVKTTKNKRQYKVHWKGFSNKEDSWISENKLSCPEILQDFLRKQKEKKNVPESVTVDSGNEEYEVERVIEVRFKKGGAREFLIRWKGFSSKDDTWEPEENLNCPDLITKFMAKVEKAKNATNHDLRANPVVTDRLTLNMKSANLRYSRRPQTQNRPTYHTYLG